MNLHKLFFSASRLLLGGSILACGWGVSAQTPPTLNESRAATASFQIQPISASATSTMSGTSPQHVISYDTENNLYWNSGTYTSAQNPTAITLDLGSEYSISRIHGRPTQDVSGPTTHQIWAGTSLGTLSLVNTWSANLVAGQDSVPGTDVVVAFSTPVKRVRYIKIATTQSPSWVAWHKIRVFAENIISPIDAQASGTYLANAPSNVYDYDNSSSYWNSGGYASQWITLNLGSPRRLSELRLNLCQGQNGVSTRHQIFVGNSSVPSTMVADVAGTTNGGDVLTIRIPEGTAPSQWVRISTLNSPGWVCMGKVRVYEAPVNRPAYFGYYGSSMSPFTNVTGLIASHGNTTWIRGTSTSDDVARLQDAQSKGMKAVLDVERVFFNADYTLRSDASTQWNTYVSSIGAYAGNIVAYYPLDEPYFKGRTKGISEALMKSQLTQVANIVKGSYPTAKLAMTFMAQDMPLLASTNLIPANFDWLGFYCYGSWQECGGRSIPAQYKRISDYLTSSQRLFLIGDSNVRRNCNYQTCTPAMPTAAEDDLLASRMTAYGGFASLNPKVIGVFNFIYQSFREDENWYSFGAADLPLTRAVSEKIGKAISSK